MAADGGGPPPASDATDKKPKPQQSKPQTKDQPSSTTEVAGEKKLSNAELKKKAKDEKAARRAQSKAPVPASQQQQQTNTSGQHPGGGDGKGGKPKTGKPDGQNAQGQPHGKLAVRPAIQASVPKEKKPTIPDCFSHLSIAKRINITQADKDVHPAVLMLGQHMSTFSISDSITRLQATLLAFKKVLNSYTTPHGHTLSRHFTSHVLNPQIDYLTACRPMCFSMGNAIRWLKLQISKIDIDLPDWEARKLLCESIDNFVRERIVLADMVIIKAAAEMIRDGEVVLTYAHHYLVEKALLQAKQDGKNFTVTLVDDCFERVGLAHAEKLSRAGIPVTYASDLGALRINVSQADLVLVAAEAMFSNGAMYARSGTCDVASIAADLETPVVALCETINFTERVSTDSLTYNEIDPERSTDEAFRLLFDTTKDKYISVVVTELGATSPMSVPAILRKLEDL